jgi:SAM-dependent methyltransferase
MTGLAYKNQPIYEALMLVVYRHHYLSRYRAIAECIPAGAAVLDVCCGPAVLYDRYLRKKQVSYVGIDLNGAFVDRAAAKGINVAYADVSQIAELPAADFVVMQASLYHFLPDAVAPVIRKMLKAAKQKVIIAEPVRNLSTSRLRWVARFAHRQTDAGAGPCTTRFDEESLSAAMAPFASIVERVFPIAGGREIAYVLIANCSERFASDVESS